MVPDPQYHGGSIANGRGGFTLTRHFLYRQEVDYYGAKQN